MRTNWTFSPAPIAQFQPILDLYRACGKAMLAQGFDNWGDFYPTETQIRADLQQQYLYALHNERNELLAVAVLDQIEPSTYRDIRWIYPQLNPFYLHRLAVNPQFWANGIGKTMMEQIEQKAIALGGEVLRLDALQINTQLMRFYESLGYQQQGQLVWHGDAWRHPFLCFEKKLSL